MSENSSKTLFDILAIIGGAGTLIIALVSLVLKLKSRSESKTNKKLTEDRSLNDRLKTVEMALSNISDASAEMRNTLKDLVTEVQNIRTKCIAHQQSSTTADLKQDLKRASERLDVVTDALRTSYVQTTVHYSDMAIINNAIDVLRQQTSETNNNLLALLAKKPR